MSWQNISIQNNGYSLERPKVCPHCHIANFPAHYDFNRTTDLEGNLKVIATWNCSNADCNRIIVTEHYYEGRQLLIGETLNGLPKGPDWPKPIQDLVTPSEDPENPTPSNFIKTYLQSLQAEHMGLDEIAGMGYRKAIEYLVKDWAIKNNPDKTDDIKKSWLGAVINNYYDGDLKDILERATWLGNDQAHYNRLFEEFDIDVLKELIDLIMVELDREHKKRHYIETIEKRK